MCDTYRSDLDVSTATLCDAVGTLSNTSLLTAPAATPAGDAPLPEREDMDHDVRSAANTTPTPSSEDTLESDPALSGSCETTPERMRPAVQRRRIPLPQAASPPATPAEASMDASCSKDPLDVSISSSTSDPVQRAPTRVTTKRVNGKTLLLTPWYPEGVLKMKVSLDHEVEALGAMLRLTDKEATRRHAVRSMVQESLQCVWGEATVKAYGSFAYGTSAPGSALDLVVEGCGLDQIQDVKSALTRFQESGIAVESWTQNPDAAFAKLKVPAMCDVVISFVQGRSSARQNAPQIRQLLKKFPKAKAVYSIVRLVLMQARCAGAAQGGLGSYALLVMVLIACSCAPNPDNAADLLLHFFRVYTESPSRAAELFVEDPFSPGVNLTDGCKRLMQISAILKNCLISLEKWTPASKKGGFKGRTPLSSILAYEDLWADARPGTVNFLL
eukprot:TRINITY_DN5673_c0_g3_i1.p2 TRINITY_DN5673_c0_g3~~TRINITY_DN5673_c0_g3_i1.p2  ORF type:complete len:444 (+),score=144.59 TRINITY_DN5673_c0_g3_i1:61-1392(+)